MGNFRATDGFRAAPPPSLANSLNTTATGRRPHRDATGKIPVDPRKPSAATHKKTRKHSRKKIALRSFAALTIMVLLVGGVLFGKGLWNLNRIFKGGTSGAAALQNDVDPTKLKGEGDGRVNILLLGRGGDGHEGPDLTDTILVASIDPVQKEAAILSIPRDFWVKAPGGGSSKINAIFANAKYAAQGRAKTAADRQKTDEAGFAAIEDTVEKTMGIPIHYHAMVDFEGFRKAIDTVGGVTVDVKEKLYDPTVAWENKNNPLIAGVGLQTFDGKRALLYARSRHGSARGDFDRATRQREILLALKQKVLSLGTFSNPLKISQLLDNFGNHVQANMSIEEMRRVYDISKDIDGSKVISIGLADPPNNYVTTSNIDGLSVVVPRAGTYTYTDIQGYVRNVLKDGFIKNENASIAIYNGTETPGLATTRATDLKSYGYNVTTIADAPTKGYTKTVLVDLRSGQKKYTKHYLEQRLKVTAVSSLPDTKIQPGTADFVIILGTDAQTSP
jgi:LCP family protein required for cell wall assembly